MTHEELRVFAPRMDAPLLFSFAELAFKRGLASRISFDFWDLEVLSEQGHVIIAVKAVKDTIKRPTIKRIMRDSTPLKVVLVEGDSFDLDQLFSRATTLLFTNAMVYVRGFGWLLNLKDRLKYDALEARLAQSRRWRKYEEEGPWMKQCVRCERDREYGEFYSNPDRNAVDPTRNMCMECSRELARTRKESKNND